MTPPILSGEFFCSIYGMGMNQFITGMDLNQLFKVNLHRRGRLNLPDNIRMVYLWMHSGGFNPPLRWII